MVRNKGPPPLIAGVSIWMIIKRLSIIWIVPPIGTIAAYLGLVSLNLVSGGHGFILFILFLFMMFIGRRKTNFSPALVSVGSLTTSLLLIWFIKQTLFAVVPKETLMTPHISLVTVLRIIAGELILTFNITNRYVGPFSIARCSAMPLVSNPIDVTLKKFWSRCSSLNAVLDSIAGPDTSSHVQQQQQQDHHQGPSGRRYQRWTIFAGLTQILVAILEGILVAYLTILCWYQNHNEESEQSDSLVTTAIIATGGLSMMVQLLSTSMDGKSHELNPKRHLYNRGNLINLSTQLRSFVVPIVFIPILSIGIMSWTTEKEDILGGHYVGTISSLVFICVILAAVICLYLTLIDEIVKMLLFFPGLSLKKLVVAVSGDNSSEACLDVLLDSVCCQDALLVQNIWTETKDTDVEGAEVQRNDRSISQMASSLLHRANHGVADQICPGEDILRLLLLENIGGSVDSQQSFLASERQIEAINAWVSNHLWTRREPAIILLVRSLSAYAGGLGEALVTHSKPHGSFWQSKESFDFVTWSLPPGALSCAEYAILGAARCVVEGTQASNSTLADWRSTHIAMLIPVVMHSAYRLHCGIIKFAITQNETFDRSQTNENIMTWIAQHKPELRRLLLACDNAAIMILKKIKISESRTNHRDFQFQSGCREWMSRVAAKCS